MDDSWSVEEVETGPLPEDLELMPPGPRLAVVLDEVDRDRLCGRDRVRLARARNRLAAHVQAELMADIYAMSLDETPEVEADVRQASRYPWTEVELAFAMRWTRTAAGARLEQARQLVEDFPTLHAALAAGRVDMPKVLVVCELAGWLEDLPTARVLVGDVLERAEELTTGQLRARLRTLVLAVDPQAAGRRTAAAVATRRVESLVNPDGTGELVARSLPPQDCAAAWERLTAIARAAKAAGDGRPVYQLRADALLDLLIGEGIAVGERLGVHTGGLAPPGPPAEPGTLAGVSREAAQWDPAWPAEPSEPFDDPARWPANRPNGPLPADALPAPRKGVVELQVPLLTLLRLAEDPGELVGFGPVVADIAAQIADRQHDGTWRFHITNELGEVAWSGITRRRPTAAVVAHVRARDHTCVAPGCRHPARGCDVDHTIAKTNGGHSGPSNLGSLCRMHHRFKHAEGTHLVQFAPGTFGWTTPRGLQYTRRAHRPLQL